MNRIKFILASLALMLSTSVACAGNPAFIEVTGTATLNIVPDRITVEIGIEEYFRPVSGAGDSVKIVLSEIENQVRNTLAEAGVSEVTVFDMGNFRNRSSSERFLMAKTLSFVLTDLSRLDKIASSLPSQGISSFHISSLDFSYMQSDNRQGLKAALDAAREKALFIASNEKLILSMPLEIVETGPNYYEAPRFSNVAFDSGAGMDHMRRISRRYSVKVRYLFTVGAPSGSLSYTGAYCSPADESSLIITEDRKGEYRVKMALFRLTYLDDGKGKITPDGLRFVATDAAGNPIHGVITLDGSNAKVVFTNSTWEYLPTGSMFEFERNTTDN